MRGPATSAMLLFELVLALLLGGALLTVIARKIGAAKPYPVLLALAGTGLALAGTRPSTSRGSGSIPIWL